MKKVVKNIFCEILSLADLFITLYYMKKHLLLIATVGSILLVPALFADTTTGTGATNTGATSTGTTGTGTSNTGTTSTGATSTGTTSTGATATGTTNT